MPAEDPLEAYKGQEAEGAWRQAIPWPLVGQRVWEDATYGTLSSDGRYVYSIEGLGLGNNGNGNFGGMFVVGPWFGRQPNQENHGPSNSLAARDLHAGQFKLMWQIGGPAGGADPMPQAGAIFLGPPLPLRGQLYVLAEVNDENPAAGPGPQNKGALLWSQQLAVVQHNLLPDALRRIGGLSPSYADGILIRPTGAGAVVAVDLATRSLRWGYRYGREKNANSLRQQQMMAMGFNGYQGGGPMPRWLDGTATIVNGRVLLTPAESDALVLPEPGGRHAAVGSAGAAGRPLPGLRAGRQDRAGGKAGDARGEPGRRQAGVGRPGRGPARRQHPQRPRLRGRQSLLSSLEQRRGGSGGPGRRKDRANGEIAGGEGPRQSGLLPGQGDSSQSWDGVEVFFQADSRLARRLPAAWPPSPRTPRPCGSAAKCCWTKGSWSRR